MQTTMRNPLEENPSKLTRNQSFIAETEDQRL